MSDGGVLAVLEDARTLGFLGPGPLDVHVDSARRFLAALEAHNPNRLLDLGSGGGVPALQLACWMPVASFVLLDSMERRTQFLQEAVQRLGLQDRVSVVRERAEVAGRDEELRGAFDAVTARSFGPPAVTAECGAPFLRVGGVMAVSEPPSTGRSESRWPNEALAALGMAHEAGDRGGIAVITQRETCPDRYPRRVGIPTKRPLF